MVEWFCGQNAVERLGVYIDWHCCISDHADYYRLSDLESGEGESGEGDKE
jgi:hypothetical protein